jgi:hypothetical protein
LTQAYKKIFADEITRRAHFYTRTQVQLSRAFGVAAPDHLFTGELTIENLTFESAITGWLDVTPIAGDDRNGGYELLLLLAGLRLVNTLGGGNSRGSGHCVIHLPDQVVVGQHSIQIQDVFALMSLLSEFDKEARDGA